MNKLSLITLSLLFSSYIKADAHYLQAIENFNGDIDVSQLINENFLEGNYKIIIYINNIKKSEHTINFKSENSKLYPIITVLELQEWGINTNYYKKLAIKDKHDIIEYEILKDIFRINTDLNKQEIHFKVPFVALSNDLNNFRDEWDEGINAFFSKYDYQGHYYKNKKNNPSEEHVHNLNLHNGVNIYAWRFRQYLSYNNRNKKLSMNQQYAYKTIKEINSIFKLGDFFTYSPNLNTYRLIGIQLNSDISMQPSSLVGYSPTIKEVAYAYSDITIEKNGIIIYQTSVPPGPFTLDNIPSIGSDGELILTIKEENGKIRKVKIWNFSSASLLRPNQWNYYFSLGVIDKKRNIDNKKKNFLTQTTLSYGISNQLTAFGGLETKKNDVSILLGTAIGLNSFGVISLDTNYKKDKEKQKSIQYNIKYQTNLVYTNTSLFFNSSFYSLEKKRENINLRNKKHEVEFYLSQPINSKLSLQSGYSTINYSEYNKKENRFFINGSSNYHNLSYSFEYDRSESHNYNKNNKFSILLNYPLDQNSTHWLTIRSLYNNKEKNFEHNLSINGNVLKNNRLSYNVNLSKNNKGVIDASINTNYLSRIAKLKLNTKINENNHQLGYGLSGGMVIHNNGITLSQSLSNSFAIIDFNGGKKIRNIGQPTTESDSRGYLVIQSLSAYNKNTFYIDDNSLDNKYNINNYKYHLTPTKGAILSKFINVKTGKKALFNFNEKIPFGATAYIEEANDYLSETFYISENNELYMSNLPSSGRVKVTWGRGKEKQCYFNYQLNQTELKSDIYFKRVNCNKEE